MRKRWMELCWQIAGGKPESVASGLFDELQRSYSTPAPRAYHSLVHIADCLRVFDGVRGLANDADGVEWALWLHDCVYDATRKDNEARSADVSTRMLGELTAGTDFADAAAAMIMATRHTGEALVGDAALVADVDMSILASAPAAYRRYAEAVRAEYSFVPEADFRKGRGAFLATLLARPVIYHRAELRGLFEDAARRNIAEEMGALRA